MIDAVTATTAQQPPQSTSSSGTTSASLNADFNTFLKLLTTQLKYQDPLNPTDTTEFTNQLVLYTQAEQQVRSNDNLKSMITLLQGGINSQAIGYIGKDVTYAGNTIYSDPAGLTDEIVYSLPAEASKMIITIKDAEGNAVRRIAYTSGSDEMSAGIHKFVWDGKTDSGDVAPAGSYDLSVSAFDAQDAKVTASAVVKARVYGVESNNAGTVNVILAGNRSVNISAVNSVQIPTPASPAG